MNAWRLFHVEVILPPCVPDHILITPRVQYSSTTFFKLTSIDYASSSNGRFISSVTLPVETASFKSLAFVSGQFISFTVMVILRNIGGTGKRAEVRISEEHI